MEKQKRIIKIAIGFFTGLALILGAYTYISHKIATERNHKLIQHSFKLLEEQIATYIKENYSGVSKIEFSPIFVDGGDGFSMFTANVVPVVYDTEGNRAVLGSSGTVEGPYSNFGHLSGVNFQYIGYDEYYIELLVEPEKYVDVSTYDHLPDDAKIIYRTGLDDNFVALVEEGYLKNVTKDKIGSSNVQITYNLEIVKGDFWKWP